MASEVTLSASARSSLLSLGETSALIGRTNNRLASGLRVASPIDDAKVFFEAKALNDRASSLNEKKDGIDQGISSLSAALEAVEAIDSLVRQAKGVALAAKTATGTELTSLVTQYNGIRTQIDNLATDATYQGLNLVNSSGTTQTLSVSFSNLTTSLLTVNSVNLQVGTAAGLGLGIIAAANFSVTANIDASIALLDSAITTLRGAGQSLGSNVALLQTRLDFTKNYVDQLEGGASKLTLADITEEGANLVALQTRQQLGINGLSFAGQSEQNILALFR
jgi:flagellin-like hook-associated protein FlgL